MPKYGRKIYFLEKVVKDFLKQEENLVQVNERSSIFLV